MVPLEPELCIGTLVCLLPLRFAARWGLPWLHAFSSTQMYSATLG